MITPTDLTPAATTRVGRGELRLGLSLRGGRTVLSDRLVRAPFGTVRVSRPDSSGTAEVQITNPSGGVLGGDHLEVCVTVGSGAAATVTTQGASKFYRGAVCSQNTDIRVAGGAFLEYLPHHGIPYAGSRVHQRTTVHADPESTVISWDALSAGRIARGERFAFDEVRSRTEILTDGSPIALDAMRLVPEISPEPFDGYAYHAVVFVRSSEDLRPLAAVLRRASDGMSGGVASASSPHDNLCVARILTDRCPPMYAFLNLVRRAARDFLRLPSPARPVE